MNEITKTELSGWGRYPRVAVSTISPGTVMDALPPQTGHMINRGMGASYGDAALCGDGLVMLTHKLDRIIDFDSVGGTILAEAGTTLAAILHRTIPLGWFPSVLPGTKLVSLGGCIAADVHGKNHHRLGGFGTHVIELELVQADGSRRVCSPGHNCDLFWATVGGMGLTGIMTRARLKLIRIESAYMIVQHVAAKDLDAVLSLLDGSEWDDQYTVAWMDSLARGKHMGRSVLIRGHHATASALNPTIKEPLSTKTRRQRRVPFDLPPGFLNRFTASLFNEAYYRVQSVRSKEFIADYDSYFFPLDTLGNWNRLYGRRGFLQYQCVFPLSESARGLQSVLEAVSKARMLCFLTTIKRFGPQGSGLLSFPMEGYTLALDFPVGEPSLFTFLNRLDEVVLRFGGRVYLAKDARLSAKTFRRMYGGGFKQWQVIKKRIDPDNHFMSDLSRRLGMCDESE